MAAPTTAKDRAAQKNGAAREGKAPGFDPKAHMRQLKGQDYLEARWRVVWFREENPDGRIETQIVHHDREKKEIVFRATVTVPATGASATGYCEGCERDFKSGYVEKAECVPLRSEILTRQGFKFFDQLTVGEEVLAYDSAAGTCAWTPLRAVTLHPSLPMARLAGACFSVDCTPDHSWAITQATFHQGKPARVPRMRQAQHLAQGDRIVLAAPAPAGDHALSEIEAAILGWLATDGSIKRRNGLVERATIYQSKPEGVAVIRSLVGGIATEYRTQPPARTFPSGKTYECRSAYGFILPAAITRALFAKAGITDLCDLPRLVPLLSAPARRAMLQAMMAGDGDKRGNFGQKAKKGVTDAFQILATLEGIALGMPRLSTGGAVPLQRLKKRTVVCASELQLAALNPQPAWCPTTDYGTWVMRQDGRVMITGNTQAVGRALAFLGYGTAQASELDIGEGEKIADAPLAPRQTSAPPVQPVPTVRRVDPRRPSNALDRVAEEMATAADADADAGDALPGQGPPPKTATVDGIRRNELVAGIQALVGAGVKLDTGQRWKELARAHEMVEPARSADMTVGWLEELYRRMRERPSQSQAQPQAQAQPQPQPQPQPQTQTQPGPQIAHAKGEPAKRERALAGWIAAAQDEATLRELRSDVMGALKFGSLTEGAAEALLEAVAARSAELDLYPQAADGASASDRADAEAEEVILEATVSG